MYSPKREESVTNYLLPKPKRTLGTVDVLGAEESAFFRREQEYLRQTWSAARELNRSLNKNPKVTYVMNEYGAYVPIEDDW